MISVSECKIEKPDEHTTSNAGGKQNYNLIFLELNLRYKCL